MFEQTLGLLLALPAQDGDDMPALLHHLLRALDQLLVQVDLLRFFVLSFAPQLSMQGLGGRSRRAQPRTTKLLRIGYLISDQAPGPLHQAGEHAHTIH